MSLRCQGKDVNKRNGSCNCAPNSVELLLCSGSSRPMCSRELGENELTWGSESRRGSLRAPSIVQRTSSRFLNASYASERRTIFCFFPPERPSSAHPGSSVGVIPFRSTTAATHYLVIRCRRCLQRYIRTETAQKLGNEASKKLCLRKHSSRQLRDIFVQRGKNIM